LALGQKAASFTLGWQWECCCESVLFIFRDNDGGNACSHYVKGRTPAIFGVS